MAMIHHSAAQPGSKREVSGRKAGFTLIELLVVVAIIGIAIALLLPARRSVRPAAYRSQCCNNLKQIALALMSYEADYHALPPAFTVDALGKPMHSWRTLILPYLEQKPLYQRIDLSKPWDDPVNVEAGQASVPAYHCPTADCPANHTVYLGIVARDGCLRPVEPRALSDITDDHGETLIVIEADAPHAVPWMAPMDANEKLLLSFGPESVFAHSGGMNVAFVDGSARFLSADLPDDLWRALISIAGNDHSTAQSAF
jgi:prepilin-type N-terminal cleavage/methylation domain-containing protein/prepilin-type processing-associated H-X9-DG protein